MINFISTLSLTPTIQTNSLTLSLTTNLTTKTSKMPAANIITVQDVLNSIKKYGKENILTRDATSFRDNKQKSKQAKFDCTWDPFKLRLENGKEVDLKNFKFFNVVTSSSAKKPSSSNEEDLKNLLIVFREVTEEELLTSGDYAPKPMSSEEEQLKENERAAKKVNELVKNTKDFCTALEAIDLSYKRLADELKASKDLGYVLNKDTIKAKQIREQCKKQKMKQLEIDAAVNEAVTVYSIRQSSYEDQDTKEDVEIKHPLTRIKLMLAKDGRVGTELWSKDKGGFVFTPNVFNSRKIDANGNPTLAKVKVNGRQVLLDANTASSFITFRSIVSGIIDISEMVISKFGISLANKFKVIYVKRHKSSLSEPTFTSDEFKVMNGSDSESDDEVVVKNEEKDDVSDLEDNDDNDTLAPVSTTAPAKKAAKPVSEEQPGSDVDEVFSEDDD